MTGLDSISAYSFVQKPSPRRVLWKGVLENFSKFTEKHLCQSLFFNKVAAEVPFLTKKSSAVKSETNFSRKANEN